MALTKAEVRNALRESILAEYADVPPAEEIDHVFSDRFLSFMAALIEEEKRGSWRLLSRQRRRALAVAAILAAALLLTACTPALREAVTEFVVTIYERFVDFRAQMEFRAEIEAVYGFDPVPEGFVFVSQTRQTDYFVETIYQDSNGTLLVLIQTTSKDLEGTVDSEKGETLFVEESGNSMLVHFSETLTTASWVYDGYYMMLSYWGQMDSEQVSTMTATISVVE